jgi:predicted amidohydrolase
VLDDGMRVAVLQFTADVDKAANLDRLVAMVRDAGAAGADLVVAPEAAMHPFGRPDDALAPVAESLDGPFVGGLGAAARAAGVTVLAGMFEVVADDPERVFNTVVALGPQGDLLGRYRKQHLFDALGWVESQRLSPGRADERLVFSCADVAVEVEWSSLVRARAIENVCYVAAADQSPPTFVGRAMVVDPFGVVLAAGAERDGVVLAEVDLDRLRACRERMPSLEHRRWSVVPAVDGA